MSFSLNSWLPWGGNNSPPSSPPPQLESELPMPSLPSDSTSEPSAPVAPPMPQSKRLTRQLGLLLGGSAFLLLSIRATRRSVLKRRLATIPQFYHPNNRPPLTPPSGAHDAVEALQLATLGIMSFAMILVGGGAFALDVSSVEELKTRVRGTEKGEEWKKMEKQVEEEFEEWVVDVLARKEKKEEVKKMLQREREEEEKQGRR